MNTKSLNKLVIETKYTSIGFRPCVWNFRCFPRNVSCYVNNFGV